MICLFLSDLVWQFLGPSTLLQLVLFHPFYDWLIFHQIYVLHLLYPFLCRWTFRLFLCPGYGKEHCYEELGGCSFLNYITIFSRTCTGRLLDHIVVVVFQLLSSVQFSSVTQLCPILCDPMDCSTPDFLSFTISRSLLKHISIESVVLSNHLILCHPLLLLPSIFPSIWVFRYGSSILSF